MESHDQKQIRLLLKEQNDKNVSTSETFPLKKSENNELIHFLGQKIILPNLTLAGEAAAKRHQELPEKQYTFTSYSKISSISNL